MKHNKNTNKNTNTNFYEFDIMTLVQGLLISGIVILMYLAHFNAQDSKNVKNTQSVKKEIILFNPSITKKDLETNKTNKTNKNNKTEKIIVKD